MKNCEHEGCKEKIEDKYHFCWQHYKASNTIREVKKEELPPGAWHSDPIVDALLKINNNLSAIKRILEKTPSGSATFKKGKLVEEDVNADYVEEEVD